MTLNIGQATTSDILLCIEKLWRFNLPKDYREYLLMFDGKLPDKRIFNFKNQENASVLDYFYSFKDPTDSILHVARDMGRRYPDTMLPIGDDVCGNRILLTVKGKDRNKVFFWDHEIESEDDEEPSYDNLTLIADSFTEFLESLYGDEDQE